MLPGPIQHALNRIDRRLRAVALARGAGLLLLVLSGIALIGMAADFFLPLPGVLRWMLWAAWLAVLLLLVSRNILRPLLAKFTPTHLAALAEHAYPSLGRRLIVAVDLKTAPVVHGSPALIQAVVDDATNLAQTINSRSVVASKGTSLRVGAGLVAALLVAMPCLTTPEPFGLLARRFLMPWAGINRPSRVIVRVTPGDRVVGKGSTVAVAASLRARFGSPPRPIAAWLEWDDPITKTVQRKAMSMRDGIFHADLSPVTDSLTYRIRTDLADSPAHRLTAVAPPIVAAWTADIEPPAYTKQPGVTLDRPGSVTAWEGSAITLKIQADRPIKAARVTWPLATKEDAPESGPIDASLDASRTTATVRAAAEGEGPIVAELIGDDQGIDGTAPLGKLQLLKDAPPALNVRGPASRPGEAIESKPDDVLALDIDAKDDLSVASVQLHYAIRRGGSEATAEAQVRELPLEGLGTAAAKGSTVLLLKPLKLQPGDQVEYAVRAADNRPAPRGPNVAWSGKQTLEIRLDADPLLAREQRMKREEYKKALDAIRDDAAANRRETEQLRYIADAVQRQVMDWEASHDQGLQDRERQAAEVADRLTKLAEATERDPAFAPLSRPARQAAEVEAMAAKDQLAKARKSENPGARLNDLRQADARLGTLQGRIDDLQRQFESLARRDADREKLQGLAAREDALAAEAKHTTADRASLDAMQAEQSKLRRELDRLVNRSPELKAGLAAAHAAEAARLAEEVRNLADRQREESRKPTEPPPDDPRVMALLDQQRSIEADARTLALDVDVPLAENGRARINIGSLARVLESLERKNLPEGRQRLDDAENELRRLARDLADVPNDPRALARRLAQRQDRLAGLVAEAVGPFQNRPNLSPKERDELTSRLKPLLARQDAIKSLVEGLAAAVPDARKGAASATAQTLERASESLRNGTPKDANARQNDARTSLNKLANALPDVWQRGDAARKASAEARKLQDEAAREVEQHLRETAPRTDRDPDPADLAKRLTVAAERQKKAADILSSLEVEPRADLQRRRAAGRARRLADQLIEARDRSGHDADLSKRLRESLPIARVGAQAALDRLDQKMQGRTPADDIVAELIDESKILQPDPKAAERLAAAVRALPLPDAEPERKEALKNAGRPEFPGALSRLLERLDDAGEAVKPATEPANIPRDADLPINDDQARQAGRLARKQRQVREGLQAILGESAVARERLKEQSEQLGEAMAKLADKTKDANLRGQGQAKSASDLLKEHAPKAAEQGLEQLAQGRADAAKDAQRRVADLTEQAARMSDDLAASLKAEAQAAGQAGMPPQPDPGQIGKAREAFREASEQLAKARDPGANKQATRDASPALQRAAELLRTASQPQPPSDGGAPTASNGKPDKPAGQATQADRTPKSGPAGKVAVDLAELQALMRKNPGRAWGELPGHLRTEILDQSRGKYRDDYARMIQLYFQQIAVDGQ